VATKDIGREIKCKKCGTALRVDDEGLVENEPRSAPSADVEEEEESAPRPKKSKRPDISKADFGAFIEKVGGMPTALFGFGLFLTIWFFFQSVISAPGGASDNRAQAAYSRVQLEQKQEIRKMKEEKEEPEPPEPPGEKADQAAWQAYQTANEEYRKNKTAYDKDIQKKTKEINKKYRKPLNEAGDDYSLTQISNARGVWWDQYGLMFGFLFLSFGCIGYVRNENGNLILRIVAGTILTVLMMAVFAKFSGCRGVG
jgi:hypothetical protein